MSTAQLILTKKQVPRDAMVIPTLDGMATDFAGKTAEVLSGKTHRFQMFDEIKADKKHVVCSVKNHSHMQQLQHIHSELPFLVWMFDI